LSFSGPTAEIVIKSVKQLFEKKSQSGSVLYEIVIKSVKQLFQKKKCQAVYYMSTS
jgi:hypothetical protein